MCFSATASFTAGTALTAVGGLTVRKSRGKAELPLALVPLLFGIQQLTEGVLWLSLRHDLAPAEVVGDLHLLVVLPRAVADLRAVRHLVGGDQPAAKDSPRRLPGARPRRGALPPLLHRPVPGHRTRPRPQHLLRLAALLSSVLCWWSTCWPRASAACSPATGASTSSVCLAFVLAVVAYQVSATTFVSVWCFYAAVLSLLIYAHFSGPMQACRPALARTREPAAT